MISSPATPSRIAIACGGTGGHLFPGLAVAEQLKRRGCEVTLLISPKEVDRQAVEKISDMDIVTLPAVGLTRGGRLAFLRGFARSLALSKKVFQVQRPHAALAMGGFTSAPPILAARRLPAPAFLHESNTIPGRANRWLSWVVTEAFVGFEQTMPRLKRRHVTVTGTPVRSQFQPRDAAACRAALGLEPERATVLVVGGSQGASGINELLIAALPLLATRASGLQWLHLTGTKDAAKVAQAYARGAPGERALVRPFLAEMELALGAATVAVSRAGASSLAELAAMRVPSVLIPFPAATDNHQFHNARAFEQTCAARMLEQHDAAPERLAQMILELAGQPALREPMQAALAQWHRPNAAEQIAERMLRVIADTQRTSGQSRPHPVRKAFSVTT